MIDKIHWLGHAAFYIDAFGTKIYIDPYKIKPGLPAADIILISHEHFDHCSDQDVKKIYKNDTTIIGPPPIKAKIFYPVKTIKPKEKIKIKNVEIEAVYAYNPKKNFHVKSPDNLGFLIITQQARIYYAGDTDFIPEMSQIKADIALLPVGGTYTMDAKEAAEAVNVIKPKFAIPMHWGSIVGSSQDAEEFKKLCKTEVRILKQEYA